MSSKTSYEMIASSRQTWLAISLFLAIVSSLSGCRSTLPPEQPSRLWEVFGRQTGRFSPKSEPITPRVHPSANGINSSALEATPSSSDRLQTSPGFQPAHGISVRPNGLTPPHQASSAMMIPPLPRDVR